MAMGEAIPEPAGFSGLGALRGFGLSSRQGELSASRTAGHHAERRFAPNAAEAAPVDRQPELI